MNVHEHSAHQQSIAVGGGKGGVGKSVVAANLACALADSGSRVLLVDADLAGANLHTLFGISVPAVTLADILDGTASDLSDVLLPTALPNLRLLCGASEFIEIANPKYARKQKLLKLLERAGFDMMVIDIGAGASLNNVDFFNLADVGLLISGPDPTAIQNAYGFLKVAVQRRMVRACTRSEARTRLTEFFSRNTSRSVSAALEALKTEYPESADEAMTDMGDVRYRLLVNMARWGEGMKLAQVMTAVTRQYLSIELPCKGVIPPSAEIANSVRRRTPLILQGACESLRYFDELAAVLRSDLGAPYRAEPHGVAPSEPGPGGDDARHVLVCLNDEITHAGAVLHVQTEDMGREKQKILSLVYRGGHILLSREQGYRDDTTDVPSQARHQHQAILAGIRAGKLDERIGRHDR